ncbi:MAG: adenylate/guanylate cyclase domain-containing protein [Bacteroidota bacterium]
MEFTVGTKRKLTNTAVVALITSLGGFVYPFIIVEAYTPGIPVWNVHFNATLIGLLLGIGISFGEFHVFQSRLRRLRFPLLIVVQTLYYLLIIHAIVMVVMTVYFMVFQGRPFIEAFPLATDPRLGISQRAFFNINVYALVVILFITFFRQVNRTLGQNALLFFFTGKYHLPVEENRVFMFLDLKASTSIAEKLGHQRYHGFLNDFFYDITPAIVESKGEIYQYVGDEVVVTWAKDRGLRDAECINCYFRVAAAIALVGDTYEKKYGIVPTFKVGYHYGTVTAGLIGDIKREIVFHGDTVNTAARIRSECTVVKRDLLLSGQLLHQLPISSHLTTESMGRIKLRGKDEEIELYSFREAA